MSSRSAARATPPTCWRCSNSLPRTNSTWWRSVPGWPWSSSPWHLSSSSPTRSTRCSGGSNEDAGDPAAGAGAGDGGGPVRHLHPPHLRDGGDRAEDPAGDYAAAVPGAAGDLQVGNLSTALPLGAPGAIESSGDQRDGHALIG